MLYRLHTEDVNRRKIYRIMSKEFDGFTVYTAEGQWQGQREKSLIMEVVGNRLLSRFKRVARKIKTVNKQEAVIIEVLQNSGIII